MFDKFTQRARKSLDIAAIEASNMGHNLVGSEHILLGILKDSASISGQVLNKFGVNEELIKQRIPLYIQIGNLKVKVIGFSPRTKKIFELAFMQAKVLGHNYVGTEHILLGIIKEGDGIAWRILYDLGINMSELSTEILNSLKDINIAHKKNEKFDNKNIPTLSKYGKDLNKLYEDGKLDPVIGRDIEIQRVIQILSRRTKNNPVLIGDPGVGKTAIIEGLSGKIVSCDVPEILKDKRIVSLDLVGMIAGAKYRGEFEERIKNAMVELKNNQNIILFIDELHTIVGAGSSEGSMDASNILKPELARGEIQIIGATTLDEYRKYIEKDSALERRFQPVMVDEPSIQDSIDIIKGLRDRYEAHHNVKITDEAISAAVNLSHRYVNDRFLPDKAIDLIDEASSKVRLSNYVPPKDIKDMQDRLEVLAKEKEEAIRNQDFENAASIRDEEKEIKEKLEKTQKAWKKDSSKSSDVVDEEDIADIVSSWTKIPVNKLIQEESKKLLDLENIISNRVIGQKEAIKAISKAIRRARVGLKDPKRPIGSFIFLGPTGVGKTELSKALAHVMFSSEDSIIRIDMSEYMEKHAVSKMIGSPPGYIGHEEGGQLTEKIRRNPYSVVLFDEIEKAHPDVFNILLQILDDGRLSDSKGRIIDFKNTLIIMTSNVGAHNISNQKTLGFTTHLDSEEIQKSEYEKMKENVMKELRLKFKPEFLNRIDEIIVFHSLNQEHIDEIVKLMIKNLQERLKSMDINLELEDCAIKLIAKEGFDKAYGARPLKRAIQKLLEDNISEEILKGNINKGDDIIVRENNGKLLFDKRA
ncbi:ATP-dependent Clp protease ATP-binding subunit [Tepidibacter aestuarii]|uniref:ATP-dependent Clp protease ATP-binding subunit n=1 Tax=Tepidibacter aestuarii TaxID=2925782 RepID=UPI0020BD76F1|nr:ATP-dependent Clp protease ATP-binding subunit [Tepidibacter aestuarii]CAH2215271.1 class III stress response-related ATPase, AAA+ superfamily; Maxwell's demon [Tepidibacter aestuarii]